MYIDDKFFDWQINAGLYFFMLPFWVLAYTRSRKNLGKSFVSTISLGTAFSLIILMINMPFLGESSAQITGATILSILFGPWVSFTMISCALLIKGIFIDSQITELALNSFILALITSFSGYYIYKIISSKLTSIVGKILSAGIGSYFSVIIPVLIAGMLLSLQDSANLVKTGKYIPVSIVPDNTFLVLIHSHALYIGIIETLLTSSIIVMLIIQDSYNLNLVANRNDLP